MTMLPWTLFASVLCAALVTWTVMPTVARLARRIGAIDQPVWRSSHRDPTPRLGGLGIVTGATMGILAMLLIRYIGAPGQEIGTAAETYRILAPSAWFGLLVGGWLIFAMGLLDDITTMKARNKLAVQVAGTLIIAASGSMVKAVGMGDFSVTLSWLSIPVTVFWLLSTINAVNLMDGVDGLVGGLSTLTFASCAAVCAATGNWPLAIFAAIWAASCAGYLPHNWNPARIFMGDCGSQLLGALQGVVVLLTFTNEDGALNLPCALLTMLIPLGDMARVIVTRLRKKQHIFSADRAHLHHLLLDAKLRPRQICGVIWSAHLLACMVAWLCFA